MTVHRLPRELVLPQAIIFALQNRKCSYCGAKWSNQLDGTWRLLSLSCCKQCHEVIGPQLTVEE